MSTSHPIITVPQTFATAKAGAADAHTLAVIASSLVAATAVAFVAMVMTAWPARASDVVRMASLAPSAQTVPDMPRAAPATSAVRTAALGTLPLPAQPCTEALAEAENDMNATLAKVEALGEADMGAQCVAFRTHMTSLQRVAATVDRCVAPGERRQRAGFIRQSMAEWRGVISNGCR